MITGITLDPPARRNIANNVRPKLNETSITAGMISRLAQMFPLRRVG